MFVLTIVRTISDSKITTQPRNFDGVNKLESGLRLLQCQISSIFEKINNLKRFFPLDVNGISNLNYVVSKLQNQILTKISTTCEFTNLLVIQLLISNMITKQLKIIKIRIKKKKKCIFLCEKICLHNLPFTFLFQVTLHIVIILQFIFQVTNISSCHRLQVLLQLQVMYKVQVFLQVSLQNIVPLRIIFQVPISFKSPSRTINNTPSHSFQTVLNDTICFPGLF